jgi:anti-sigma regulatory factor (Ser/Thr protein kinase)/CheY-like chemotaxis protein
MAAEIGRTSPKTALVINVSEEVGAMVRRVLDRPGWQIVNASSNLDALARLQAGPFDIVVTSETTSGKEDVELLRKIRLTQPHTRMIILAHQSAQDDVIAAMREHAFSYFTQPFSMEELATMLQEAIDAPCWDDGIEVFAAKPNWIRLFARCDVETANRLVQFLREVGDDLPDEERKAVGLAFREMLLNAIEHGGHFNPDEYVEISYLRTKRAVTCRIKDPGKGFSLAEIPHAAVANPPEEPLQHLVHRETQGLRSGGYGVLLARELVDELIYGEKGNEVLLIKYIDPTKAQA